MKVCRQGKEARCCGSTTIPTVAEQQHGCSEASLKTPLNRTGGELYETLMREVFGDHPVLATIPLSPAEPLTGMADDARRRLARALQIRLERSPVRGKQVIALLPGRGSKRARRRSTRTAADTPASQESEANP